MCFLCLIRLFINKNKNMKRVRLTENQLHRLIKESVNRILNEDLYNSTMLKGQFVGSNLGILKLDLGDALNGDNTHIDYIIKDLNSLISYIGDILNKESNSGDMSWSKLQIMYKNLIELKKLIFFGDYQKAYNMIEQLIQFNKED